MKVISKGFTIIVSIILAYLALFYIPLPYYVTQPGSAEELDQFVTVENGYKEKGEFMFTTVAIRQASPFYLLLGSILPFHEIEKEEEIMMSGESDEDYNNRQEHYMKTAQEKAVYNAYVNAGKDVKKTFDGIFVMYVAEKMPAHGVLKVGDIITAVDGIKMESNEMFYKSIGAKKVGDDVHLSILRDGKKMEATIPVKKFDETSDKIGIGISYEEEITIIEQPVTKFHLEDVGGPSAGLMFTLEIFNQLTEEDFTKGYKIAGTGTIDFDGTVGPIGGISQKIVAADDESAEIFFAPNEKGANNSNYKEAVKTAKKIKTDMLIVPVDNVSDAINYLKKLEEK